MGIIYVFSEFERALKIVIFKNICLSDTDQVMANRETH